MADERCPECSGYRGLPRIVDMTSDTPHECTHAFHKEPPPPEPPSQVIEFPQQPHAENTAPVQGQPAASEPAPGINPAGNPLCPWCGEEGGIVGKSTRLGPFLVMVVMCRRCHKIVGTFQAFDMQLVQPPTQVH